MSWAEEKTLEKFIFENQYDPSEASVIGLFPRNMILSSLSVPNEIAISGHGFLFTGSVNGSAKIEVAIGGSRPTGYLTEILNIYIDDEETPFVISSSATPNTYSLSTSASGPNYDTGLLYIAAPIMPPSNLSGKTLNGPIEFKHSLRATHSQNRSLSNTDGWFTNIVSAASVNYILLTGGGNVETQFQNFPGLDFCENVCHFLSRNLKERRNAA